MPARRAQLRRSPVDGWATYVATAPVLTSEGLVNRELLDVRGPLRLDAGGGHRGSDPGLERIEVLAWLPAVDHAPPFVDRPRGVKQQPLRGVPCRVNVLVHRVELLFSDSCELDSDTNGHGLAPSVSWMCLRLCATDGSGALDDAPLSRTIRSCAQGPGRAGRGDRFGPEREDKPNGQNPVGPLHASWRSSAVGGIQAGLGLLAAGPA